MLFIRLHLGRLGAVCECRYKETQQLGIYVGNQKPEQEITKGTHDKRQPTNAGQPHYTTHKRQSGPKQAAVQAANQHTTLTSRHTLCHRGTRHRYRGTVVMSQRDVMVKHA